MTRIAAVHEWLPARAGSEKTFEEIARALPTADLYALSRDPATPFDFGGRALTTTFLDRRPLRDRRVLALPLMPLAWRLVDTPEEPYDLVVTSSHAFANLARPTKDAGAVLCYCHTPARYLWVPELDQDRARIEPLLAPARALLKRIDLRGASRVTEFAANSSEVAGRIRRFYDRDAIVIPPPVDTEFFASEDPSDLDADEAAELPDDEFVMAMSRFIPYKRIDLAIRTAAAIGVPIVVAGSGDDEARLRDIAVATGHDVRFVIRPSQQLLRELFRRATLLLFPAHEDFGIVPVEAQACGTPVVGYAAGGALDSIDPGATGELAAEQTVECFTEAAERALAGIVTDEKTPHRCREWAAGFGAGHFRARISSWVDRHVV